MILMALDHVRDFFGTPGVSPTNLAQTTVPLFLTRWITHVCAPTFFLLTGTGAFLSLGRKSIPELSRFLFIRGVWLIVLELTVIRCLGFQFNFDYQVTMLVVIWALGWAMIVLAALVWLPPSIILAFGVVMIAGHNLLDGIRSAHPALGDSALAGFRREPSRVRGLRALHADSVGWRHRRRLCLGQRLPMDTRAAAGISAESGPWPGRGVRRASRDQCVWRPCAVVAAGIQRHDDRFVPQRDEVPAVLAVSADGARAGAAHPAGAGWRKPRILAPALVFGRVPLFYFLLHLPLIHLLAVIVCYWQNGAVHWMFQSPNLGAYPFTPPPGWGLSLPTIYLLWVLVVLMLYPACRWFASVKQSRTDPWLTYL